MKVLVTGGAGFIGSHFIDRMLNENNEVVCFDNFDNYYPPDLKWRNVEQHLNNPKFKLVSGTVTDSRSFSKAFDSGIDVVVHLAAQAGVRPSMQNPNLHFEVNVLGTINALELCRKHNIKKFVFASSSSVYGNHPDTPFRETHNVAEPLCPYAASKKSGELVCYTYHHLYDMDIACIRPFTVYGSRQRIEMAIPLFTRLTYEGKTITFYGDGSTIRDYTHVLDVVDGIARIIERKQGFQIYNLGTQKTITLKRLVDEIWKALTLQVDKHENNVFVPKPVIRYEPANSGEAIMTYADISKAKSLLGYSPKMNIISGIQEYVGWYYNNIVRGKR